MFGTSPSHAPRKLCRSRRWQTGPCPWRTARELWHFQVRDGGKAQGNSSTSAGNKEGWICHCYYMLLLSWWLLPWLLPWLSYIIMIYHIFVQLCTYLFHLVSVFICSFISGFPVLRHSTMHEIVCRSWPTFASYGWSWSARSGCFTC